MLLSSRAQLTRITGPIGEKGFGKAIIGTRSCWWYSGPFKLPSFSFCKLKLLLIQVKATSRRAAFLLLFMIYIICNKEQNSNFVSLNFVSLLIFTYHIYYIFETNILRVSPVKGNRAFTNSLAQKFT